MTCDDNMGGCDEVKGVVVVTKEKLTSDGMGDINIGSIVSWKLSLFLVKT